MMDPRIAARRRRVLESSARKGIRTAIWILGSVALVGVIIWLLQSPFLDVNAIEVSGAERSDWRQQLTELGVEEGMPMIWVRTGKIEDGLVASPWVAGASVHLVWPGTLEIELTERVPVAWVWAGGRFALVDLTATVLEYGSAPEGDLPVIRVPASAPDPGGAFDDAMVQGAVEFAHAAASVPALQILADGDELSAVGGGHRIVLGRAVDMAEKGAALVAVLADGPPAGAEINLTAPTRPAVTPAANSQSQVEG